MEHDQTVGQRLAPSSRRALNEAVIESNYQRGALFVPVQFKAAAPDEDPYEAMRKPCKFRGFGNTGRPDLGDDIVDPNAFTKPTLAEFLKFGRQLMFMHNPYAQIGEITSAETVQKGERSMFGIRDGGLLVGGFVDSPIDEETGTIPDHELAKVIHFARMQVRRGRLKLLSIGWRPTKTEMITAPDPRRNNEERRFRLVKSLILGEISFVTMAMSPQSIVEANIKAAFAGMYGPDIAEAMFAEGTEEEILNQIPEKVDALDAPTLRRIFAKAAADARRESVAGAVDPDEPAPAVRMNVVHLADAPRYKVVSLSKE